MTITIDVLADLGCNATDAVNNGNPPVSCNPPPFCCDSDPESKWVTVSANGNAINASNASNAPSDGKFFKPWDNDDPTFPESGRSYCTGGTFAINRHVVTVAADEWNTWLGANGNTMTIRVTASSTVKRLYTYCCDIGIGCPFCPDCAPETYSRITLNYTGVECTIDEECDDGVLCTIDTCEGGVCVHTPVPSTQVTYVDADATGADDGTSWANAYTHLEDALATACGAVWVAAGVYKPTDDVNDREATFALRSGVRVFGGFSGMETELEQRVWSANVTGLSGDLNGDGLHGGNSYHVVTAVDTDDTTVLDGFFISMGNGDNSDPPFDKNRGGGIHCDGCSAVFRNCIVFDNRAWVGAGMMIWRKGPGPDANPTLFNCLLAANTATGFAGSVGGGIYSQAVDGGNSEPSITNCTFSLNNAALGGGGWSTDRGTNGTGIPLLTNCIFWGNTSDFGAPEQQQVYDQTPSLAVSDIRYSCIEGCNAFCLSEPTNIGDDPLFRDVVVGNFRLDLGSPCIDAGDNSAVPLDSDDINGDGNTAERIPFDLDGNSRFVDDLLTADTGSGSPPIVDMGAYESPKLCENATDCGSSPLACWSWACDLMTHLCFLGQDPAGTPCQSLHDDDCDNPDTCDAEGICRFNFEPPGVPCGSPLDTECDNPDTCNGSGSCLSNLEPDGTACPNGLFCDGEETCQSGICVDNVDPCIDGPHCDEANDVCLECLNVEECGDVNGDGITDDNCKWYECLDGFCNVVDRVFADAGGANGACPLDGFCNIHDANHVLNCFGGIEPCEDFNMDLAGPFGACPPDGFCNIHDANIALACFSGLTSCSCPGGEMAPMQGPQVVGAATLAAVPAAVAVTPDTVRVRVLSQNALEDLRGYQLDVLVSGGTAGQLELLDITIEPRDDFVFAGRDDAFEAFNVTKGQMLCGLETNEGVAAGAGAYLATYTYRVPTDAAGEFVIDFAHDESAGDQTFLIASNNGKIAIADTTVAVVAATAETP